MIFSLIAIIILLVLIIAALIVINQSIENLGKDEFEYCKLKDFHDE